MQPRTCVHPSGKFIYGVHRPDYSVSNFRENDWIEALGRDEAGEMVYNHNNFPQGEVRVAHADPIYEIPNPFPFRGTTYIARSWAEAKAANPSAIRLKREEAAPGRSFPEQLQRWHDGRQTASITWERKRRLYASLSRPMRLAVALLSKDADELMQLGHLACDWIVDETTGKIAGLRYQRDTQGRCRAVIHDESLFDAVANNPHLPDDVKQVLVLKPGAQGGSEIVGETGGITDGCHVFEYLRRNSYIPWGHYAANMAHDAVRYRARDLTSRDLAALRHLYYQRTYARVAQDLGIAVRGKGGALTEGDLEDLRVNICRMLKTVGPSTSLAFDRTLWGWNFGYGYAPTGYRLHASHQQVHQQFAMVPSRMTVEDGEGEIPLETLGKYGLKPYACGDLVADFARAYHEQTGRPFFDAYIQAIRENRRMDGRPSPKGLIIHEDGEVMLFAPKAQTSQWEIQLMALKPVGNILSADTLLRRSLDRGIGLAARLLENLGAEMITVIEYAKPLLSPDTDQRLLYAFLPRLPESPGAFSEAQLRFICGHYPEDFAAACRQSLEECTA